MNDALLGALATMFQITSAACGYIPVLHYDKGFLHIRTAVSRGTIHITDDDRLEALFDGSSFQYEPTHAGLDQMMWDWAAVLKEAKPEHTDAVRFINDEGAILRVDPHVTLGDLLKMGVKEIKLVDPDEILPKGSFRHVE